MTIMDPATGLLLLMALDILLAIAVLVAVVRLHRPRKLTNVTVTSTGSGWSPDPHDARHHYDHHDLPRLWGNGATDDTEALQARVRRAQSVGDGQLGDKSRAEEIRCRLDGGDGA